MTEREERPCQAAVSEALQVIGSKWGYSVIAELYCGSKRSNELRRRLGGIGISAD